MLGCPARLGVAYPSDEIANLNTEEDMDVIIYSQSEKFPDNDIDLGTLFINSRYY